MSGKEHYETQLLDRIKSDSDSAFEEIYERYWQLLFNFGMRKLNQREVVEGIVQEVFIDFWLRRKSLDIRQSLSTYLHSCVHFRIINQYKSRAIRTKYLEGLKTQDAELGLSVEEMLQYRDLRLAIKRIVRHFPFQRKKAYKLRFDKGLSYQEIANTMDISVSTVEKHLIRAVKDLRVSLREFTLMGILTFVQDSLPLLP